MWDLRCNNKEPHITQNIICKVDGNPKRNFCKLCLKEKLLIIKFPNQDILLNKRSELISKCRHKKNFNHEFLYFQYSLFLFLL